MAMQISQGQGYKGKRPFMQCEYCNLKGHTKENYYKLIEYPTDFKSKKNFGQGASSSGTQQGGQYRRPQQQQALAAMNNISWNSDVPLSNSEGKELIAGKFFTDEQYQQILALLNKDTGDSHANLAVEIISAGPEGALTSAGDRKRNNSMENKFIWKSNLKLKVGNCRIRTGGLMSVGLRTNFLMSITWC
uniref:Uncharacterized protein LOC104223767 n=1 Tax=Nicotiana sylvestris TaxID=4096 RepID=A0A1U7WG08_NICSY|nr:PREDICTED: uncharacterized protein LOC104223767 [Nicotiana sylvestris]